MEQKFEDRQFKLKMRTFCAQLQQVGHSLRSPSLAVSSIDVQCLAGISAKMLNTPAAMVFCIISSLVTTEFTGYCNAHQVRASFVVKWLKSRIIPGFESR